MPNPNTSSAGGKLMQTSCLNESDTKLTWRDANAAAPAPTKTNSGIARLKVTPQRARSLVSWKSPGDLASTAAR